MDIRRLRPVDASTYRVLMLGGYDRHPDAFTATVAERGPLPLAWWEGRLDERVDADEIVFGAWDDGRLVGVGGLRFEARPKTRHKAVLYGMYVEADAAGRGVGKALVDAVLDAASRRGGMRVVQLTVSEGNERAADLYRRCGFAAFGTEPLAISGDGVAFIGKVHMWLDLDQRRAHA